MRTTHTNSQRGADASAVPFDEISLVINAGSGTIAVTAYVHGSDQGDGDRHRPVWSLDVVRHRDPQEITVTADGSTVEYEAASGDLRDALEPGLGFLWNGSTSIVDGPHAITRVANRIVHGGSQTSPVELTDAMRRDLDRLAAFAPLHNPPGLQAADIARSMFPDAVHFAAFDTSFHATMPSDATTFGGPTEWLDRGIRRYGFHGISHRDASRRAAEHLGCAIDEVGMITIHLGGGCSATAVERGESVDTTMGMTPLDGMVMATRSGSVDPGVLLHLLREDDMSVDRLEETLNRKSGLMGLTAGHSGDIGEVHRLAIDGDERADLAVRVYVHAICKAVSGLRPSLDRLDAIVFTGGAVEQEPWLRGAIARRLDHLGATIDDHWNAAATGEYDVADLGNRSSETRTMIVASDENLAIARLVATM